MKPESGKLVAAAHDDKFDLVSRFLAEGSDVNERDENGAPALFYAVLNRNDDAVQLLLKHGANVNEVDEAGRSLLWWSIAASCPASVVSLLLDHGAIVSVRHLWLIDEIELKGDTGLEKLDQNYKEVAQLIRQRYAEYNYPGADPFLWASKRRE